MDIYDRNDLESVENFNDETNNLINKQKTMCKNSIDNALIHKNNNFNKSKEVCISTIQETLQNTNQNINHLINPCLNNFSNTNISNSYLNINTHRINNNTEYTSNRDNYSGFKKSDNSNYNNNIHNQNNINNNMNFNMISNNIQDKNNFIHNNQSLIPSYHINSTNRTNFKNNINNNTNNNLIFDDSRQSEENLYTNFSEILEVDKEFINFPISFPGEILTLEININNISNIDICFSIDFCQKENLLKIFKKHYQSDIKEIYEEIPNSQIIYGCFSLSYLEENSNLIELDNLRVFLKKGKNTKIIICLKTPQIKKKLNLFTCLEFSLIFNNNFNNDNINNSNRYNSGESLNFLNNQIELNEMEVNNYNNINKNLKNENKNFFDEKFLLKNEKYFKYYIPILGCIEIPKLLCLKELLNEKAKFPFISLLLEIKSKGQKFKIPFKNFSIKDIEIEFIFEKSLYNNIFCYSNKFYECQFLCFPNKIYISSQGVIEIDLIAKIKKFKTNHNENFDISKIGNRIRKVLIAKIKNASVYYSFFIEATFIKKKEI